MIVFSWMVSLTSETGEIKAQQSFIRSSYVEFDGRKSLDGKINLKGGCSQCVCPSKVPPACPWHIALLGLLISPTLYMFTNQKSCFAQVAEKLYYLSPPFTFPSAAKLRAKDILLCKCFIFVSVIMTFLAVLTWTLTAVCCSPALFSSLQIVQVSAWLPHWSAARPNTRLCLFNNRAQPSVNSNRKAALTKHDSDRQTDLTDILQRCSNSPFTDPCALKLPCHVDVDVGETVLDSVWNDRE